MLIIVSSYDTGRAYRISSTVNQSISHQRVSIDHRSSKSILYVPSAFAYFHFKTKFDRLQYDVLRAVVGSCAVVDDTSNNYCFFTDNEK